MMCIHPLIVSLYSQSQSSRCLYCRLTQQAAALASRRTPALIGRQEELEAVRKALEDKKVAVIHAAPGEGKSRLAAEAASHFPAQYAFINLWGRLVASVCIRRL